MNNLTRDTAISPDSKLCEFNATILTDDTKTRGGDGGQGVIKGGRIRDPLFSLPKVARRPPPKCSSRRSEQAERKIWREDRVLQQMISGLHNLHGCGKPGEHSGGKRTSDVHFSGASRADHSELERLRKIVGTHLQRHPEPYSGACESSAAAAYWRLGKSGYDERGELCRTNVGKIALPEVSACFPVSTAVPEFTCWKELMLLDQPVPGYEDTPSYSDPVLAPGSLGLIKLVTRLFKCGLVEPCRRRGQYGVQMFTVVKNSASQRLVFDMRRVNKIFKIPPKAVLGSARALASLDLSDESLGGDFCCGFGGDVPNMFYQISLGKEFGEYVWLEGVPFSTTLRHFVEAGLISPQCKVEWERNFDGFGFVGLPMGFSWAPLLAQKTLEFFLEKAGETFSDRLRHNAAVPIFSRDARVNMGYLDDFVGVARGASSQEAENFCTGRLARVRGVLDDAGLGCHKEQVGSQLIALGVELDLDNRCARPRLDKFNTLLLATRHLLGRVLVHPKIVARILGHWAWFILLRPEMYSIFQEVYFFVQVHRDETGTVKFPPAVREEFRTAYQLSPLLYADLACGVDREVICTDACPSGGAVCYATKPQGVVSELVRNAESWEDALNAPDEEFFLGEGWKVGAKVNFDRPEDIQGLEARTVVLAVERAVRKRSRRNLKLLVFTDNQSALGAFRKGRSSAWVLLRPCRRVAALSLFAGLRITYRWVPTDRNCADAPSRGAQAPGVFSESRAMNPAAGEAAPAHSFAPVIPLARSRPPQPAAGPFALPNTLLEPRSVRLSSGRPASAPRAAPPMVVVPMFTGASPAMRGTRAAFAPSPRTVAGSLRREEGPTPRTTVGSSVREKWALPGCGDPAPSTSTLAGHAVTEGSSRLYEKGIARFRAYLRGIWEPGTVFTARDVDQQLARFFDVLFEEGRELGFSYLALARQTLAGVLHAYPQFSGQMAVADRALSGWEKVRPPQERGPISWGVALLVAGCMAGCSSSFGEQAALITLLCFDCFLRGDEWEHLRASDVSDDQTDIALSLGTHKATKTGRDQGVVVSHPLVRRLLRDWCKYSRDPSTPIFSIARDQYSGLFSNVCVFLGLSDVTPHVLRHGGATHFTQVLKRGGEVMQRGRWKTKKSVARYSKPHALIKFKSSLRSEVASAADRFEANPELEIFRARFRAVGGQSSWGHILHTGR